MVFHYVLLLASCGGLNTALVAHLERIWGDLVLGWVWLKSATSWCGRNRIQIEKNSFFICSSYCLCIVCVSAQIWKFLNSRILFAWRVMDLGLGLIQSALNDLSVLVLAAYDHTCRIRHLLDLILNPACTHHVFSHQVRALEFLFTTCIVEHVLLLRHLLWCFSRVMCFYHVCLRWGNGAHHRHWILINICFIPSWE